MAEPSMDLGRVPSQDVYDMMNFPQRKAWEGKVAYTDEIQLLHIDCPVCKSVVTESTRFHRQCTTCGMWEAKIQSGNEIYFQRICLITLAFGAFGDSRRKQQSRIARRDKAILEAKRLWERREDSDCAVYQFGEINPDDWQAVSIMADWLAENDFPIMEEAARAIAEARKTKERVPSLQLPDVTFPKPKNSKD